jgi:hypothetical protein
MPSPDVAAHYISAVPRTSSRRLKKRVPAALGG